MGNRVAKEEMRVAKEEMRVAKEARQVATTNSSRAQMGFPKLADAEDTIFNDMKKASASKVMSPGPTPESENDEPFDSELSEAAFELPSLATYRKMIRRTLYPSKRIGSSIKKKNKINAETMQTLIQKYYDEVDLFPREPFYFPSNVWFDVKVASAQMKDDDSFTFVLEVTPSEGACFAVENGFSAKKITHPFFYCPHGRTCTKDIEDVIRNTESDLANGSSRSQEDRKKLSDRLQSHKTELSRTIMRAIESQFGQPRSGSRKVRELSQYNSP